ncbi:hypothetical protein O181_035600 [Austropuccinia psidii MF-1]|uniref:CCHC-type domain-containing protein n=1 Tax=Austropuccinia psidii MF-1 TaxID=1389203 RepID=A0A9Q3D515_9BASI|nr:hypothetical protein [Austropuccinia psidii MF-1]
MIQAARWHKDLNKINKLHGYIVLYLLEKELSLKIEKPGLYIDNEFHQRSHYLKRIPQCYKCWKTGHPAPWCKNNPLCAKCGSSHDTNTCTVINKPLGKLPCITKCYTAQGSMDKKFYFMLCKERGSGKTINFVWPSNFSVDKLTKHISVWRGNKSETKLGRKEAIPRGVVDCWWKTANDQNAVRPICDDCQARGCNFQPSC